MRLVALICEGRPGDTDLASISCLCWWLLLCCCCCCGVAALLLLLLLLALVGAVAALLLQVFRPTLNSLVGSLRSRFACGGRFRFPAARLLSVEVAVTSDGAVLRRFLPWQPC